MFGKLNRVMAQPGITSSNKPVVPFCLQRFSLKVEKKRCVLVQVILGASEHQLWPDTRDASEPLIQVLHDLCRKLLRALVSGTAMEDMWLKEKLGKELVNWRCKSRKCTSLF